MSTPEPRAGTARCRFCDAELTHVVLDLGISPLANSYVRPEDLEQGETFYPLRVLRCAECMLVQLGEYASPEAIFGEYAYFSSASDTWLEHAQQYTQQMVDELGLPPSSFVAEVASNDGYLLRYFKDAGFDVLGVEPARNVAAVADERGIPTLPRFFGVALADELAADRKADLLVANNVLAHVPNLNDFVAGLQKFLAPDGTLTIEFPHLLRLVAELQYDTIYHEHFSYFSLATSRRVLAAHGLTVTRVEELPTHGGSLRLHVSHTDRTAGVDQSVEDILSRERAAGLDDPQTFEDFGRRVRENKLEVMRFLLNERASGRSVAAYGAPAKGNTLLNYCGIDHDLIEFTVDRSPAKQGSYLPGSRIPVLHPDALEQQKPDTVFVLPWNLFDEIAEQIAFVREWGGQLAVRTPELVVR